MRDNFFPGFSKYLETLSNSKYNITAEGLEDIVAKISARTGLDYNTSYQIVGLIIQEIRNAILRDGSICLEELGSFYLYYTSRGFAHIISFYAERSLLKKVRKCLGK